jgi:DNA-binding NtrC family response regulator
MPNKAYQVLVVEDDEALRATIREALNLSHFMVREAVDGIEALERIQKDRPDLVLLAVTMPRLSGLECLKRIKEFDPSIVVIVLTAYTTIEDAVTAIKEGAYNYLVKPVKHQAIVEMVERALAASQMIEDMAFSTPRVQAVAIESQEQLSPSPLPGYLQGADYSGTKFASPLSVFEPEESETLNYKNHKEQFEKEFIVKALKTFKGRINQTALHAQIPKKTLLRKLLKYNIRAEDYRP